MLHETTYYCPECDEGFDLECRHSRRAFIGAVGAGAALVTAGASAAPPAADAAKRTPKPAEGLIREPYATLSPDQKKELVLPWPQAQPRRHADPPEHVPTAPCSASV